MPQQRRSKQHLQTFEELLADEAIRYKEAAEALPEGTARDLLLRRVRQAETACHMSGWVRSPDLQPPK